MKNRFTPPPHEQVTGSRLQVTVKERSTKANCVGNKFRLRTILSAICFLLIFVCSCDLFNATVNPDLWKKIDEEIAWSNAPKLTMRLEYPAVWGTSNPQVGGVSYPGTMDLRQGYEFTLDFTPTRAYTLVEWRAYETASLTWPWDETALDDAVRITEGIEFPETIPEGGTFSFKINSGNNITLVPYSISQPRVYRYVPSEPDIHYPSATQIMI